MSIRSSSAAETMRSLGDRSVQLLVTDPPFGTGDEQKLESSGASYVDPNVQEAVDLIEGVLCHLDRVLTDDGLAAILLDHRAVHETAVMSRKYGKQFGEIVWHFETGGAAKKWWSNKHNTILLVSPRKAPLFNLDEVPTVERKAPKEGYTSPKRVSSVWNVNMSTTDPQRVGYPSQKPLELYERLIRVHTSPSDLIVDPFAGSGTAMEAAIRTGRNYVVGDISETSVGTMNERLRSICPQPPEGIPLKLW